MVGDVDEHELVASREAGLALDGCVLEVVVDEELVGGVGDEVHVSIVVEVGEEGLGWGASDSGSVGFGEGACVVSEVVAEVWA